MMRYPKKQAKVQEEIDRVIGDDLPSLKHRSQTPYVEATLLEIQRLATVVPWAPRATLSDVKVSNFSLTRKLIHEAEPQSWPVVNTILTRGVCTSVHPPVLSFQNLAGQNKF